VLDTRTFLMITIAAAVIYHLIWYFRYRDSLLDCDFSYNSYHALRARIKNNRRLLSRANDIFIFKSALLYIYYWAYGVFTQVSHAPRALFACVNTLTTIMFSIALLQYHGPSWPAFAGVLLYCILSSAPQLGGLYLQGEFWALSMTGAAICLILTGMPVLLFVGGCALAVNTMTVKPVYLFESVALLWFVPDGRIQPVIGGFLAGCAIMVLVLHKDGFTRSLPFQFKAKGFFSYWLGHNRKAKNGKKRRLLIRDLVVFIPVAAITMVPLILPAAASVKALPAACWVLLAAEWLIVFTQFRFYRYHFACMLPGAVFLYAGSPPSIWIAAGLIPLTYTISYLFFNDLESLDFRINRMIPHYHTRNIVAPAISRWIRSHTSASDRILIVGDTLQIYSLGARPTTYEPLYFCPMVYANSPAFGRLMQKCLETDPPEYILPMLNCLNWKTVRQLTQSVYRFHKGFVCNGEFFPIYGKKGHHACNGEPPGDLFIPCLRPTNQGLCWNPLPGDDQVDPNPTLPD
jgi:hypothetical protein